MSDRDPQFVRRPLSLPNYEVSGPTVGSLRTCPFSGVGANRHPRNASSTTTSDRLPVVSAEALTPILPSSSRLRACDHNFSFPYSAIKCHLPLPGLFSCLDNKVSPAC